MKPSFDNINCIDGITSLPIINTGYFIYFLYDKEKLLYVGSTKNILSRIGCHLSNGKIPFNKVLYAQCSSFIETKEIETYIIQSFSPLLNKEKKSTFHDKRKKYSILEYTQKHPLKTGRHKNIDTDQWGNPF
jgi:predicted GIY-YIG superfamily endonuclease